MYEIECMGGMFVRGRESELCLSQKKGRAQGRVACVLKTEGVGKVCGRREVCASGREGGKMHCTCTCISEPAQCTILGGGGISVPLYSVGTHQ